MTDRRDKRVKIMGEKGVVRQDKRRAQAKLKAVFKKGDSVDKAEGRQAVKRVGEYKQKAKSKRMNTPLARAIRAERRKSQIEKRQEAEQHETDF